NHGKIVACNFTFFSPSGDWAKYVYSIYREDGTLAKVSIDYRTFNGDMILLRSIYFDRLGKQLRKTDEVQDLQSHKPKKLTKDEREEVAMMLKEVDYSKTTAKLPYARLVKK